MTRTVTAYYDNRSDAEAASQRLVEAGIKADRIRIHGRDAGTDRRPEEEKGFFEQLGELFVPDEDRHTYAEGVSRGGYVLSASTGENEAAVVADILEKTNAVDLDAREKEWRSQGWQGYSANAGGTRTSPTGPATGTSARSEGEATIPIAEERMRVGKRETGHGRIRVRSYVVETPVEKDVTLRDETVHVDRKPVDRAAGSADRAFQDRTVEVEEHREEPVVSKEARIKEEVRVSKEGGQRTEHVRDTVRRTEVDVEDERRGRSPQAPRGDHGAGQRF